MNGIKSLGNREERDIKYAAYWCRESAEQGNILAQYEMGNCCYYGWGMDKDSIEATYWYHEAAKKVSPMVSQWSEEYIVPE